MPHVFPARFPFFEIAAPSRCVLPDLSDVEFTVDDRTNCSPQNKINLIATHPSLEEIKIAALRGDWATSNASQGAFIQNPKNEHWGIYSYLLNTLNKQQIPTNFSKKNKLGANAESFAWNASSTLFSSSKSPAWLKREDIPSLNPILNVDAIFSSVWIDRPNPLIPYIIDQLWVLSWAHAPQRRFIVGIEIDGPQKWDVENQDSLVDSKDKAIARSNTILNEKIALFRLGSQHCISQNAADLQIQDLWRRLSTAAFLRRMNVVSFLSQDTSQTDDMFSLMVSMFKEKGFTW